MNIDRLFIWIFSLCVFFPLSTSAQSTYQIGALPAINFNYKLKKNWSVNLKTESRQVLQRGDFKGDRDPSYEYILTDNTLIAAKKVGLNSRISGGYLFRYRQGEIIQRFIQQYTITQKFSHFRLSHRVVTDQTFEPDETVAFRLRYRLASEIPLNGTSADV